MNPPVALWVSTGFATFVVELTAAGRIDKAPPIACWSIDKRFSDVHRWATRKDRQARFAWIYADGTTGEEWR